MNKSILLKAILIFCPAVGIFANDNAVDTVAQKNIKTITVTTTTVITEQDLGPYKIQKTDLKVDTNITEVIEPVVLSTEFVPEGLKKTKYWQLGSDFNIGFSQIAFFNWFSGGSNSTNLTFTNKSFAYYERNLSLWKTDFEMNYGIQQQAEERWFKNKDVINLESIYGFKASSNWYYSALLKFKSQIAKGYNKASDPKESYISRLLSPAYSTFSLGMEYNNSEKNLSVYLSPMAYEITFVIDTALSEKYLKQPNIRHLTSFGPMGFVKYNKRISRNMAFDTQLDFFADVLDMKEPFIKLDWKLNFSYRLTRYLQLTLKTNLIYDPKALFDVMGSDGNPTGQKERKVQFSEQFLLTFTYRIRN